MSPEFLFQSSVHSFLLRYSEYIRLGFALSTLLDVVHGKSSLAFSNCFFNDSLMQAGKREKFGLFYAIRHRSTNSNSTSIILQLVTSFGLKDQFLRALANRVDRYVYTGHGITTVRLGKKFWCFSFFQSVSLLSDALAIHTAMAVAIANGGTQRPQRPQRCSTGAGPKFKLIHEGDIQVCRLNHSRTLISKVLSSKFLRRWEAHHVYLGDFQMYSATVS